MKTVEDAVRDLKGVWPSREDRCSSLYVYKDGDYHALDPQWHDDYTGVTFVCSREEFDECKAKLEGKPMKLIDILARELEEWPDGAVYVVQDYDGDVKYSTSKDRPSRSSPVWIRTGSESGKKLGYMAVSTDWSTAIVTREQWEKARREMWEGLDWLEFSKAKSSSHEGVSFSSEDVSFTKPKWNGPEDGLPPVGTVCEAYDYDFSKWRKCQTLGAETGDGERACVTLNERGNFSKLFWGVDFRPLTLKSDRDRWIEQSCEAVESEAPEINTNIYCSYAIRKNIEVIYDAGLGKLKEEE